MQNKELLTQKILTKLVGGGVVEEGSKYRHEDHLHVVQRRRRLQVRTADIRVPTL